MERIITVGTTRPLPDTVTLRAVDQARTTRRYVALDAVIAFIGSRDSGQDDDDRAVVAFEVEREFGHA